MAPEPAKPGRTDIATRIIEHATRLFAARGYVGASLHDIAQAVGIRKPSLLYHFRSKEDLRRGVLEQLLSHWAAAIPRILEAASTGQDQFDAIANETVQFFADDPDRARLILRELLDRPEDVASLVEVHVKPWAKVMSDEIRKGQSKDLVYPDVDPEAWVTAMINMVLSNIAVHASLWSVISKPEPLNGRSRAPSPRIPPRVAHEMMRLAKRSLFIGAPPQPPTKEDDSWPTSSPTTKT